MFKMLALEQSSEKWPFSAGGAGGGRPTAPTPPWQQACNVQVQTILLKHIQPGSDMKTQVTFLTYSRLENDSKYDKWKPAMILKHGKMSRMT